MMDEENNTSRSCEEFERNLDSTADMDCIFIVGAEGQNKQELCCSKTSLANCSPVFQAMFFGSMPEKGSRINIPDVDPQHFYKLIEYATTGSSTIYSLEEAVQLLYVTNKYLVIDLKLHLFKEICKRLKISNVCDVYELALQYDEPVLAEHCLEFIRYDAGNVLQQSSIEDIQQSTLIKIMEQDHLNISSELIIINACIRWSVQQAQSKNLPKNREVMQATLGRALSLIRFLSLTAKQFIHGVAKSGLLSNDECYSILCSIVTRDITIIELPSNISTNTQCRKYVYSGRIFARNVFEPDLKICSLSKEPNLQDSLQNFLHINQFFDDSYSDVKILRFTVDQDILLHGFQVATCSIQNDSIANNSYVGKVVVRTFLDELYRKEAKVSGNFAYGISLPVLFQEPLLISKDIDQESLFHFASDGLYRAIHETQQPTEKCIDGINFKFHQNDSDGMVYSILFSKISE